MASPIKDEELYEKLRKDQGYSKEKAARIANAANAEGRSKQGEKGGHSPAYEEWTVEQLRNRAKELDLSGYSSMTKKDLVNLLRNH